MPDAKHDVCPVAHAASSCSTIARSAVAGCNKLITALDTTFLPDSSNAAISAAASAGRRSPVELCDTASASRARIASKSSVARTPVGARPHSSPASLPAFASLCTHTPTSSRSGCSRMPCRARRPTLPVANWITFHLGRSLRLVPRRPRSLLYGMAAISHTGVVTVRRHIGAVVVVALALIVSTPTTASAATKDPFAGLDASMRNRVKADDLAGGVLLVVRGDSVIHAADFGALDADSQIPIASASKWLTSATLM